MKAFPFFIAIVIILTACKKTAPSPYWGEVTVIFNDESLDGKIRGSINKPYNQGIDIHIDFFNATDERRGSIFLYKIPPEEGVYVLSETEVRDIDTLSGASFSTLLADGDVIGDFYDLLTGLPGHTNRVTIDKKENEEIWGTFQAAFIKNIEFGEGDPGAPDTIFFDNGLFHTRIFE